VVGVVLGVVAIAAVSLIAIKRRLGRGGQLDRSDAVEDAHLTELNSNPTHFYPDIRVNGN
jgi:hypothetical protein